MVVQFNVISPCLIQPVSPDDCHPRNVGFEPAEWKRPLAAQGR